MPRTQAAPYSISYLKPAPAKVVTVSAKGHQKEAYPAEYLDRVNFVFNSLHNPRAKAAFYALYRPIIGHHQELEGLLYNAPPHWDDRTMTATEVDGSVIERFASSGTGEQG